MISERPEPRPLLVCQGVLIVAWSVAMIPLAASFDLLFADLPAWIRLSIILATATAVAAPMLLAAFRKWRLCLWLAALTACLVVSNIPWCEEKRFYLAAERVPKGASLDVVKARMAGYSLRPPAESSNPERADVAFDWDGNFAVFTFKGGRLTDLHLIPD